MSIDGALIALLRAAATVGGALALTGSAVMITSGNAGTWWSELYALVALFSVFFAVFVWLVIPQQPRNAVVWTMGASAFFGGIYSIGLAGIALVLEDPGPVLGSPESVIAAELPSAARILMFSEPAVIPTFFPLLTFGLLLFPDGRLPSPRWVSVGVLAGAGILAATLGYAWGFRPGNTQRADESPLFDGGLAIVLVSIVISLAALFRRFSASGGQTREQFKWVVWGASVFAPVMVGAVLVGGTRYDDVVNTPLMGAAAVFLGSYGMAVGRYRLFDIDLVISRTFVLAGLAAFVTLVYATVVGGFGVLFGAGTGAALPLSVAATVVVALAFHPLQSRMRRWAGRLVYGERATPYEVLSQFSAKMRHTLATEDVIPQMAQLLTAGTGASPAIVWMKSGDELQPVAIWPERDDAPVPVAVTDGELTVPGVDRLAPVEHDGELLGAVTVTMPRGQAMTATEERLVDDVAAQAGLVLRNARLTANLVETIHDLRSSRQRLVATQDDERRRLERDLHDGAQQHLVALKIKASLAQQLTQSGDNERAAELLQQVVTDSADAVDSLRDLAHGIYPPLLEAEGLGAALETKAAKSSLPVSVCSSGLERYPEGVEAAIYFCVLEALQNTTKYANATRVKVTLSHDGDRLSFHVTDDGDGFDTETHPAGRGLVNMADRLDALGGHLDVRSSPGRGTTIAGTLDGIVLVDHDRPRPPVDE